MQDNLNTLSPAALYEDLEPTDAKRVLDHLESRHTPIHGSWLNRVEIEIGILSKQRLGDRISDESALRREIAAWGTSRNERRAIVDWRFTSSDSRTKSQRLCPNVP